MVRNFSSVAGVATLTENVGASGVLLKLSTAAGLPAPPFTLVLEPGTAAEEIVTVTGLSGLDATVIRAQDGTPGVLHGIGSEVRHMMTGRDLQEPHDHIDDASGVHGVSGAVVGTSDSQTLTNKTINGGSNNLADIPLDAHEAVSANRVITTDGSGDWVASKASPSGDLVGTTDTQTLTNKTIDGSDNTLTDIDGASLVDGSVTADKLQDTGWLSLTLSTGTGFAAASGYTPQVRQVGDDVRFRGAIQNAAFTGAFTTVASLPAGIDPPGGNDRVESIGGNTGAVRSVKYMTDGQIQVYSSGTTSAYYFLGGGYLV